MGRRRYLRDLPQGGLEITCKLILLGKSDDIKCQQIGQEAQVVNKITMVMNIFTNLATPTI